MTTLDEIVAEFKTALKRADIEDPATETRILVGGLLKLERTHFLTRGLQPLNDDDVATLRAMLKRRLSGEPPYRILGHRSFFGLEFELGRDTLEPRPDTEILVDLVLEHLASRKTENLSLVDLGTGTGAICLALLSELPNARGLGVDLSEGALEVAMRNAQLNGLDGRFRTVRSNWFDQVEEKFDVIVSNPPYIKTGVLSTLSIEVREHDPHLALDGGPDGLAPYRIIAARAATFLNDEGLVGVETGYDQRIAVEKIFASHDFELVEARKDYAGNDRAQLFRHRFG